MTQMAKGPSSPSRPGGRKKLGEILVAKGVISQEQFDTALNMAKGQGKRIGETLIDAGMAKEEDVAKALAEQFNRPYVDPTKDDEALKIDLKLIPEELIRKYLVLPRGKKGNRLELVIHDPKNLETLDLLRFKLGVEIDPVIAARGKIKQFLDTKSDVNKPRMVAADESLMSASIDKSIDKSMDKSVDSSIDQAADSAPIIKLVNRIIIEAVKSRASDIHIEPMADRVRLRYRIDGVCLERDNLPKRMQNAVLARFKLTAGMNIAEKRMQGEGLTTFLEKTSALVKAAAPASMLHGGISNSFDSGVARLVATNGVKMVARSETPASKEASQATVTLFSTDASNFEKEASLKEEVFGPTSVVTHAGTKEELERIAESFEGQLTAAIHGTADDLREHARLVRILERKAGRIIFNGFGTGIEVCPSMHHGGPYPSSTHSHFTSIGTAAIYRFVRPVCYQGFPDDCLPEAIQNKNVTGAWRMVDGEMTKGDA